jgi:hypothetical protein
MLGMTRWRLAAVLAVATALTALTGLPLCNAVFDCGCTWFFAGGDAHCDIHHPGPPDCPLCAHWVYGAPFFGGLWAAWAAAATAVLSQRPRRSP